MEWQNQCKFDVITLAKCICKGSCSTEKQNQEQAVNQKSGSNIKKP